MIKKLDEKLKRLKDKKHKEDEYTSKIMNDEDFLLLKKWAGVADDKPFKLKNGY